MKSGIISPAVEKATRKIVGQLDLFVKSTAETIDSKAEEITVEDIDKIFLSYVKPLVIYSALQGKVLRSASLTILEKKEALLLSNTLNHTDLTFIDERGLSSLREISNIISGTFANVLAHTIHESINSTQPLIANTNDIRDIKENLLKINRDNDRLILLKSKFKLTQKNVMIGLYIFLNKEAVHGRQGGEHEFASL